MRVSLDRAELVEDREGEAVSEPVVRWSPGARAVLENERMGGVPVRELPGVVSGAILNLTRAVDEYLRTVPPVPVDLVWSTETERTSTGWRSTTTMTAEPREEDRP